MNLNSYLFFDGRCEEALRFYAELLGGEIETLMTYKGSPMEDQTDPGWHDKIMHGSVKLGGQSLMGSDSPPQHFHTTQGFGVSISLDDVAEGEHVFKALAENGQVTMPFQKTFWAHGFGMVTDRFGTPWMVNCDQPA
ncbi:MAG: VOC family protein [Geminicoccaceae bacterium]